MNYPPFLGSPIPVLGMKVKQRKERNLVIFKNGGAFDSAKNYKRRRERQSVTAMKKVANAKVRRLG